VALRVFNTLTRKKQDFVPAHPKVVRIYTCGLTVYSAMHIGHARTYCFWDVFRRYLEYRGYHVISVINYTDIDDRIMGDSAAAGEGCLDLAERVIGSFRSDCRSLQIKDYAAYTRATDFIEGQIEAIKSLLAKGHAYVVGGEVLYDVRSFANYGQLSGNRVGEGVQDSGGRLDGASKRKRNPEDFTLWKPSDAGQPCWETGAEAWPSGRPGWHIECSAMSTILLGDHFDVHGGGADNRFPHHENELAQAEPLCGHPWVRYWMHPDLLQLVDDVGKPVKMSKSLGNVIGIPELLERYDPQLVRWFYGSSHYRSTLAFGHKLLEEAGEGFKKIRRAVRALERRLLKASDDELRLGVVGTYASLREEDEAVPRERETFCSGAFGAQGQVFMGAFIAAMDEDMGTAAAEAAIYDYVNALFAAGIEQSDDIASLRAAYRCLTRHLYVLGVEWPHARLYPELAAECFPSIDDGAGAAPLEAVIDRLLMARARARADKEWAKSDLIRDLLADAGVLVEDTPKGARWELAK